MGGMYVLIRMDNGIVDDEVEAFLTHEAAYRRMLDQVRNEARWVRDPEQMIEVEDDYAHVGYDPYWTIRKIA